MTLWSLVLIGGSISQICTEHESLEKIKSRTFSVEHVPCKQGLADRWRKSSGTSGHNIVVDPLRSRRWNAVGDV